MAGGVSGAYAEFCLVPANLAIPVPDNLTDEEAAAVPVNWTTAYLAMVSAGKLQRAKKFSSTPLQAVSGRLLSR